MKKNVNASAKRQKAAKKMYVPQVIDSSMSGVTRPIILDTSVRVTLAQGLGEMYGLTSYTSTSPTS
jgi:vacuolar-type H+-ATPase subunit I/STV1